MQHFRQHVVGLDFQVVGLKLDGHVAVAQVVGGANQVKQRAVGAAVGDAQHRLGRSQHFDERTVFSQQHVATTHSCAAWQKHAQRAALAVSYVKAAFLAHVPVELNGGGAFEQHIGQTLALGDEFGAGEHGVWLCRGCRVVQSSTFAEVSIFCARRARHFLQ